MRRLLILVSLLLLLAAPGVARAADAAPTDARLADAAAAIAGRPVQVRCEDAAAWSGLLANVGASGLAGYVLFTGGAPSDTMELAPETCAALAAFLRTPTGERCNGSPKPRFVAARPRTRTVAASTRLAPSGVCAQDSTIVYAVWTLAHEAVHLAGQRDETVADCTSLQLLGATAARLGAAPAAASALAAYAADWYAKVWPSAKPGYYSSECRDGGALDVDAGAWPA